MAKRKRLMPAQATYLSGGAEAPAGRPGPLGSTGASGAPIARVASEASAQAALQELSGVLENARTKGLMIEEIPLAAIDETYLVRDRIEQDADEMAALMASLRSRGQQTPIEVVPLEAPQDGTQGRLTHGLISGWRRLSALKRLYAETSEPQFATVKALVIRPESAAEAYVAMVEENEIRVNLSHYERARIAVRALKEGVYETQKQALQGLFANAPRAKRSKIGSFVTLVEALDSVLRFPTAISEKLGLALVRELNADEGFAARLTAALEAAERPSAAEELEVLARELEAVQAPGAGAEEAEPAQSEEIPASPAPAAEEPAARPRLRPEPPAAGERIAQQAAPGVRLAFSPGAGRIELTGSAVDADLAEALAAWLQNR
ncbi:ParB/RepB/Spo0J family partition protein (plasmid) [Roseobacteraceae bacterium NS-SX3]